MRLGPVPVAYHLVPAQALEAVSDDRCELPEHEAWHLRGGRVAVLGHTSRSGGHELAELWEVGAKRPDSDFRLCGCTTTQSQVNTPGCKQDLQFGSFVFGIGFIAPVSVRGPGIPQAALCCRFIASFCVAAIACHRRVHRFGARKSCRGPHPRKP